MEETKSHKVPIQSLVRSSPDICANIHHDEIKKKRQFPEVIELNVGGVHYTTSLITLTKGQDNMLSSMFSGRHELAKDSQGRYFIDADGPLFVHILRYLRSGKLPEDKIAAQVYHEAGYFGLDELQANIEKMPVMQATHARLQFQKKLDGFDLAAEQIFEVVCKKQGIVAEEMVSYAVISIIKTPVEVELYSQYDPTHECFKMTSSNNRVKTDVYINSWKDINDDAVTERVYLKALSREFETRGFKVTFTKVGCCSYAVDAGDGGNAIGCERTLYKMIFHWHK